MITTGKNLGAIIGDFGKIISEQNPADRRWASSWRNINMMANPKYGSEKKGAPTNYYLTVAPERIKVNCELNHVDVVLCCDPKAFTHTNPLEGLKKGGSPRLGIQRDARGGLAAHPGPIPEVRHRKQYPRLHPARL